MLLTREKTNTHTRNNFRMRKKFLVKDGKDVRIKVQGYTHELNEEEE